MSAQDRINTALELDGHHTLASDWELALQIMGRELRKLYAKSVAQGSKPLDPGDARVVTDYSRSLSMGLKDQREADRLDGAAKRITDAEVEKLADDIVKARQSLANAKTDAKNVEDNEKKKQKRGDDKATTAEPLRIR